MLKTQCHGFCRYNFGGPHRRVGSRPWWRHHCPLTTPGKHRALYLLRAPAYSTSTPLPNYNNIFHALRHVSPHLHRNCPRLSRIMPRFNLLPPQFPALIDQGAIASTYSAAGAVSAIYLYFYDCARPDGTNVNVWASSFYGHFELLLPPGEGWPDGDITTPRKGNENRKRGAKGSPLQPSPPKRETPEEMLLKEEQLKRVARNNNVMRWDLVLWMCPSNSKLGLRMSFLEPL